MEPTAPLPVTDPGNPTEPLPVTPQPEEERVNRREARRRRKAAAAQQTARRDQLAEGLQTDITRRREAVRRSTEMKPPRPEVNTAQEKYRVHVADQIRQRGMETAAALVELGARPDVTYAYFESPGPIGRLIENTVGSKDTMARLREKPGELLWWRLNQRKQVQGIGWELIPPVKGKGGLILGMGGELVGTHKTVLHEPDVYQAHDTFGPAPDTFLVPDASIIQDADGFDYQEPARAHIRPVNAMATMVREVQAAAAQHPQAP